MDTVHQRHDEDEPGAAGAVLDAPQPELHAAFVLLEDLDARRCTDKEQQREDRDANVEGGHRVPFSPGAPALERRRRSAVGNATETAAKPPSSTHRAASIASWTSWTKVAL